jgi:hypothetical protein
VVEKDWSTEDCSAVYWGLPGKFVQALFDLKADQNTKIEFQCRELTVPLPWNSKTRCPFDFFIFNFHNGRVLAAPAMAPTSHHGREAIAQMHYKSQLFAGNSTKKRKKDCFISGKRRVFK